MTSPRSTKPTDDGSRRYSVRLSGGFRLNIDQTRKQLSVETRDGHADGTVCRRAAQRCATGTGDISDRTLRAASARTSDRLCAPV